MRNSSNLNGTHIALAMTSGKSVPEIGSVVTLLSQERRSSISSWVVK